MSLTKEDLGAIREIVREIVEEVIEQKLEKFEAKLDAKFEQKLNEAFEPMRETMRQLLLAQVEIVEKVARLEKNVNLIMDFLNVTPTSLELRKTLHSFS